jgi:DNA-binding transcriptional ArsR family regulator
VRGRSLLDGGVDRLFNTLHHTITWRPPVLTVAMNSGFDFDVHLKGQGLRLQASVFAGAQPVLWDYDLTEEPPTLVYPAYFDGRVPALTGPPSVVALVGRTRAQLLAAITDRPGTVTGELARQLGISPASASEHATVLRNAGLITTVRYGKAALHTVTPLGAALLGPITPLTDSPDGS